MEDEKTQLEPEEMEESDDCEFEHVGPTFSQAVDKLFGFLFFLIVVSAAISGLIVYTAMVSDVEHYKASAETHQILESYWRGEAEQRAYSQPQQQHMSMYYGGWGPVPEGWTYTGLAINAQAHTVTGMCTK